MCIVPAASTADDNRLGIGKEEKVIISLIDFLQRQRDIILWNNNAADERQINTLESINQSI